MEPILILRHIACEGPGYLGDFLARRGLPYRLVAVDEGERVPTSLAGVGGLALMGGPMSVNDPLPWIAAELALIREACAQGLPVLGHCLGGQLIARALGGVVGPNPVKEIGWHEVVTVPPPSTTGPLARLPERFEAFHWHGETFSLPEGATLLMKSAHCAHQAFIKDSALALQFHVEVTPAMVHAWLLAYQTELQESAGQTGVQSATQMSRDLERRCATLRRAADRLYDFWLETARP